MGATDVSAHPGGTDSSGGHTCRTNCPKWGLTSGQYHTHGGTSTPTPDPDPEETADDPPKADPPKADEPEADPPKADEPEVEEPKAEESSDDTATETPAEDTEQTQPKAQLEPHNAVSSEAEPESPGLASTPEPGQESPEENKGNEPAVDGASANGERAEQINSQIQEGGRESDTPSSKKDSDETNSTIGGVLILLSVGAIGGATVFVSRRNKRQKQK